MKQRQGFYIFISFLSILALVYLPPLHLNLLLKHTFSSRMIQTVPIHCTLGNMSSAVSRVPAPKKLINSKSFPGENTKFPVVQITSNQ